jgi:hypothetical protein
MLEKIFLQVYLSVLFLHLLTFIGYSPRREHRLLSFARKVTGVTLAIMVVFTGLYIIHYVVSLIK